MERNIFLTALFALSMASSAQAAAQTIVGAASVQGNTWVRQTTALSGEPHAAQVNVNNWPLPAAQTGRSFNDTGTQNSAADKTRPLPTFTMAPSPKTGDALSVPMYLLVPALLAHSRPFRVDASYQDQNTVRPVGVLNNVADWIRSRTASN